MPGRTLKWFRLSARPRLGSAALWFSAVLVMVLACPATADTGILEVDSNPGGAQVWVDGKRKGTTPEREGQRLAMELPEGEREVELRKQGYATLRRTVFVGDRVIQPSSFTLKPEPFTNSLGMKFVPVPGTRVLFCLWETRVRDYTAYAAVNPEVDMEWRAHEFMGHKQGPDHPVVAVSWEDAKAFCIWLSTKEGRSYRLPTDHEWSVAVGIGDREDAKASPNSKDGSVEGEYPWGRAWPPPPHSGNYSGDESAGSLKVEGYRDPFPFTAPVGSFPANIFGLHDLGGNVWEWVEDSGEPGSRYRVLRGGSWSGASILNDESRVMLSSSREGMDPDARRRVDGFRIVLEVDVVER